MFKPISSMMKIITLCIIIALSLFIMACSTEQTDTEADRYITENNVDDVCEVLKTAGLSNVDVFRKWVMDSPVNEGGDADAESNSVSDADCRMTVMLLAGDSIKYDSLEEEYNGDYLMLDLDAIENDERFAILKDKVGLFTTLFGEEPIPDGSDDGLAGRWKRHGIKVDSDKFSIITIHFKAYDREETFVGHTGILVDCRDQDSVESNYLFVEKIAFGGPFFSTPIKDENELIDILSARQDYTVEEGEQRPFVYKNGELIGQLR